MASEVIETHPPVFREDAQKYGAIPICRSCAEKHRIRYLVAFVETVFCGVKKCENYAAYLAIG